MKIFSSTQIKKWDAYTIEHEPITALDLMERAAAKVFHWLEENHFFQRNFHIFCGRGNNGGDGLVLARMLINKDQQVAVYLPEATGNESGEFSINLNRLQELSPELHIIRPEERLPVIHPGDLVIDALFGTGLNKPPTGIYAALINYMNQVGATVISIDLPSGLFADSSSKKNSVVKASHTLSFQNTKLAFLVAENEKVCGTVHLLDIGLNQEFEKQETCIFETIDPALARPLLHSRKKFAHKGEYGHAALIAGSKGMMGAAVLAARGCLRSGVGKLTCYVPECGLGILQSTAPEAMCRVSGREHLETVSGLGSFRAVGFGPGLGTYHVNTGLLDQLFSFHEMRLVIDADALNLVAANPPLVYSIPPGSILTPHPGEFGRLFGEAGNDFSRIQLALEKSAEHGVYILLKGHHTLVCTPEGKGFFNTTGNPGMATGGSGDVLCGILTGLLAQGYSPLYASLLGVYLHGLAGDEAAKTHSMEAMIAGDIADQLGGAFRKLSE